MLEIYFETYGCTANYNSTEIMKGLVKRAGFNLTSNLKFSDIVVINSCIVKEPTEEKIRRRIFDILEKYSDKKIIVAGCMPCLNEKKLQEENLFLLDTSHVKDIANLIYDIQNNSLNPENYLKKRDEVKLCLPKIPHNKIIGITQISEGCLGNCAYCITKFAKGKLFSYPEEKIIESIKEDISSGCKEIWITSQDNSAYRNEFNEYKLPELLKKILAIPGNFFIRLGMMNPEGVLQILQELIEIYKNKKIFRFIHIPVQSGSNKILKKMNRKYSREDILKIIKKFKKEFPIITISTDIIVGFPGETEEDFRETLELIKEIKPEILNISKFWSRPKTLAATLENQISPEIKRKRAAELSKLHFQICNENQKNWLGWSGKVLIDKKGFADFPNTYLARDENYKLFAVQSEKKILGEIIKVKVKRITAHYLISDIVG